jgi:hypothetical protein
MLRVDVDIGLTSPLEPGNQNLFKQIVIPPKTYISKSGMIPPPKKPEN